MSNRYAFPEYLVETEWVAEHLNAPNIRIIESNEDQLLYDISHIPGAVKVDWFTTLQDSLRRDFISREEFETLCSDLGINNNTTLVFYGDKNNWFACYALWLFQYYGHQDVKVMNGGRAKWEKEKRPMSKDIPSYPQTTYKANVVDPKLRAFREDVFKHLDAGNPLVDVRSPKEYSGELLHMANYPQEGAMRGGHIPGAANIPWSQAIDDSDGTFKSVEELKLLYERWGISPDKNIIAYCRIGERSSHTWFVLKYLLGFPNVRNYDGSWTEWGNLVNAPIEK